MIVNFIKMQFLEKQEEVSIKYALGYSPKKMVSSISRFFSFNVALVLVLSLILLSIGQYFFATSEISNGLLQKNIDYYLWSFIIIIPVVIYLIVNQLIYHWLLKSWRF